MDLFCPIDQSQNSFFLNCRVLKNQNDPIKPPLIPSTVPLVTPLDTLLAKLLDAPVNPLNKPLDDLPLPLP